MQLNIKSLRSDSYGRSLCQYNVDGINTIGAWGEEPFAIKFTNSLHQMIQVKLSLDGTDLLTGGVANLNPSSKMWVVDARDSMELKA